MKTSLRLTPLLVATSLTCSTICQAQTGICNDKNTRGIADKIECNVIVDGALVIAAPLMAYDQLKYAVFPWTPVQVELPDGSRVSGKLSPMAREGRTVYSGDTVRLSKCTKTKARTCELMFERKDPAHSMYQRNNPRFGEQSYWFIGISAEGVPQESLLKIDGKVPPDDGYIEQATPGQSSVTEAKPVSTPDASAGEQPASGSSPQ